MDSLLTIYIYICISTLIISNAISYYTYEIVISQIYKLVLIFYISIPVSIITVGENDFFTLLLCLQVLYNFNYIAKKSKRFAMLRGMGRKDSDDRVA